MLTIRLRNASKLLLTLGHRLKSGRLERKLPRNSLALAEAVCLVMLSEGNHLRWVDKRSEDFEGGIAFVCSASIVPVHNILLYHESIHP